MNIYCLTIEAIPNRSNPESTTLGGAYIVFWVKAKTKELALRKAKKHLLEKNWRFLQTESIFTPTRDLYIDTLDSLECYDEAGEKGLSFIFNTWPVDE